MQLDYNPILTNIAKHIALDEKEVSYFVSLLKYKEVSRKEVLLNKGEPCNYISYLNSGALRAYYLDKEGNENLIMFALKDWWITDMFSFATRQPAMLYIDALENSSIFKLYKDDLDKLFVKVPKFEKFFRIIMQNAYIREQVRVIENLSLSAEERYVNFINKYSSVVQQLPQKQIASYLGITPQFLSLIRKRITKR